MKAHDSQIRNLSKKLFIILIISQFFKFNFNKYLSLKEFLKKNFTFLNFFIKFEFFYQFNFFIICI
jgi:hypothetical protein